MSNEKALVRSLEQSMAVKSLKDLVRVRATGEVVLLIDVSYSMSAHLRNGKKRIEGLREVVKGMKEQKPLVKMIAFGLAGGPATHDPLEAAFGVQSSSGELGVIVDFVESVPDAQGSTPLAEGIDFARTNGFGRAVVISDGRPNDMSKALASAKIFGGKIDVVYVGDPGDAGSSFLDQLAKETGGIRFEGDLSEVKELTSAVVGLLGEGGIDDDDDDEDDEDEDDEDEDDEDEDDEDEDDE